MDAKVLQLRGTEDFTPVIHRAPMQLLAHQKNQTALRDLARAAIDLLLAGKVDLLAEQYGYALAAGRDFSTAIRSDVARALANAGGTGLLPLASDDFPVVYYRENSSRVIAVIDCDLPTADGAGVRISFVVSGTDEEQFFTLEDICAAPAR
jgi:hypothetical protein